MEVLETAIAGVYIIMPQVYPDRRGFFYESFNINKLKEKNIDFQMKQENCAFSEKKGTIRGLHFQNAPMAQAKIVRCIKGAVLDYAIDLRKASPTFKQYMCVELTEENKKQLFIPKGFAHGVISIVDNTMIEYVTDEVYSPEYDRSIRYNDPEINIDWGIEQLILSEKDMNAPLLCESDCNF